jgi:hypothetical protein
MNSCTEDITWSGSSSRGDGSAATVAAGASVTMLMGRRGRRTERRSCPGEACVPPAPSRRRSRARPPTTSSVGGFVGAPTRHGLPVMSERLAPAISRIPDPKPIPRLEPPPAPTSIQRASSRGEGFDLAYLCGFRAVCGPVCGPDSARMPSDTRVCHSVCRPKTPPSRSTTTPVVSRSQSDAIAFAQVLDTRHLAR